MNDADGVAGSRRELGTGVLDNETAPEAEAPGAVIG